MRRHLTSGEIDLATSMFGKAISYAPVTVNLRRWFPFQPANVVMAPDGHLWINPKGKLWSEDYSRENLKLQALFLHELTHVLQTQERGRYYLLLMRHPFCRYDYKVQPGRPFGRYGLEQQAEIVRHLFLARNGLIAEGAPPREVLESIVPFKSGQGVTP
jgi:hypothetical protein